MNEKGYLKGPTCIQNGSLSKPYNNLREILTEAIMTKFFKQKQVNLNKYKNKLSLEKKLKHPTKTKEKKRKKSSFEFQRNRSF